MSAAISPNSGRSASSFAEPSFEGAEDIIAAWVRGLAPDPLLTVSEWADRYRFLSSRASSEAGRYRTDRTLAVVSSHGSSCATAVDMHVRNLFER